MLCNFNNRQYSTLPANLSQNIPAQIWIACSNILSHCVKSFQIRIYFWSIFGHFSWMSSCVNRSCFSFFFRSIFSASSRGNKRSVVLIKFFRYIWIAAWKPTAAHVTTLTQWITETFYQIISNDFVRYEIVYVLV